MSVGIFRDCPKFLSTHYSNDTWVVAERNFQRFRLHFTHYMFGNFTQDMYMQKKYVQSPDSLSVISK